MGQRRYAIRSVNKIFTIGLFAVLVLFAAIACSYSYIAQKKGVMLQCESVLQDIFDFYYEKVYGFSDIYIPVFESDENKRVIRSYFGREGEELPDASERAGLVSLLGDMIWRDRDIAFIALYNPDAVHNYCLFSNGNFLKEIWEDIPVGDGKHTDRMQLLGRYTWKDDNSTEREAFLIRGGALSGNNTGCILVGYHAEALDRIIDRAKTGKLAAFVLMNETGVLYDSAGGYKEDFQTGCLEQAADMDGIFTSVIRNNGRAFLAAYHLDNWQVLKSCSAAWSILLVLVGFALFALTLYRYSMKQIFWKVDNIQEGLMIIGDNRLDYRLTITNGNDEFDEIAANINRMAERLKDSIEKEYQMRMRQKWSELNQIQARFNPHFLYNTLEVIRGRLFQNGDMENADYIEKLSRIFRNLTDAAPITSIREEIAFCSMYMALLQLCYHDAVEIMYDVDAELQECGILTHLVQPAIENYFVHAISEETDYHFMEIICEQTKEGGIRFVIADNGNGIPVEQLEAINQKLRSPAVAEEGYGLASIAKRIRLFYGEEYGIALEPNMPCGVRVIIVIPRMSIEEHWEKLDFCDIG